MKRFILLGLLAAMCAGCAGLSIPGGNLIPLLLLIKDQPPKPLPNDEGRSAIVMAPQDREFFANPETQNDTAPVCVARLETPIVNLTTEHFQYERELSRIVEVQATAPLSAKRQ
jgi:hypothetical protein